MTTDDPTAGDDPAAAPPPVRRLELGDTALHYVEQGTGAPVVFVHGAGGDWRTWEPLRPLIAARYRFVAYSRRYHWPNDPAGAGRPYTVGEQAEDLIAFATALGAGPVHVVGGSYGARVVLEAAVRRPTLFRSVAASEAFITPPVEPAAQAAARALADDLGRIAGPLREGDAVGATAQLVAAVYGDAGAWDRLSEAARRRFLDNRSTWGPMAAAPAEAPTPCDALGRLPMPLLVLEGETTVAGFRVTNDRLMQCLPGHALRYVVPGAPHLWYPVNPAAAAARILDFVAAADRAAPSPTTPAP